MGLPRRDGRDSRTMDIDPHEAGGAALLLGFLIVLATLYRDPASGLATATVGPGAVFYFLVLPAAGLLCGGYVLLNGPYSGVPLFVLGSYLGVFGLGLLFGSLLAPGTDGLVLGVGLLLSGLATVALVASAWRLGAALGFGRFGASVD